MTNTTRVGEYVQMNDCDFADIKHMTVTEYLYSEHRLEETMERVEDLRDEAAAAGDLDQVAVCSRALAGDDAALRACIEAIADAQAQID